jgi:hypothetical protein
MLMARILVGQVVLGARETDMKTLISMLFVCSVGCAPSLSQQCSDSACMSKVAGEKAAQEHRVVEHTVWNYSSNRITVCTMRCVGNDCVVVECQ